MSFLCFITTDPRQKPSGDDNKSGTAVIPECEAARRDKEKGSYKNRGYSELVSESTSWVVAVILESRSPGSVFVVIKKGKFNEKEKI